MAQRIKLRYQPLLSEHELRTLLKQKKDLTYIELLEGKNDGIILDITKRLHVAACEAKDDETALKYLEYHIKAVEDSEFRPILDRLGSIRLDCPGAVEILPRAQYQRAKRAFCALEWWTMDHPFKPLKLTRQRAIFEIVAHAVRTANGDEAANLMKTLCARLNDGVGHGVLDDAVRDATGGDVSPERIARSLAYLNANVPDAPDESVRPLIRQLAIAFVRNSDERQICRVLGAVAPLADGTKEMLDELGQKAKSIAFSGWFHILGSKCKEHIAKMNLMCVEDVRVTVCDGKLQVTLQMNADECSFEGRAALFHQHFVDIKRWWERNGKPPMVIGHSERDGGGVLRMTGTETLTED